MKQVQLVGIVNLTPDSFSGDGIYGSVSRAVACAEELFASGADSIDVGAEATNPWVQPLTAAEEWRRLEMVLANLLPEHAGKISLDTYHPITVKRALELFGTDFIVNDVTGMNDPNMREVVAKHGLECIISHLPAHFGTDIKAAHAHADVDDAKQVLAELLTRRDELMQLGLPSDKIILDPGIGFGKTMRLNWDLLQFADLVLKSGIPSDVMVGYSHKRFLGELRFAIQPNLDAAKIAISAGTVYLRVHDVRAHRAFLTAHDY